jgi:hypothetical protein
VVLIAFNANVRPAANQGPECNDRLQKDCGGIRLSIRRNGGCNLTEEPLVSGWRK